MGRRSLLRSQRGTALTICIAILFVVSLAGLTLMSVATSASRLSLMGWQKSQADYAAQSGVYAIFSQVSYSKVSNVAPITTPIGSTQMGTTLNGITRNDGSFTAQILNQTAVKVNGQKVTTYLVEGDGTAPNSTTTSAYRATFTLTNGWAGPTLENSGIVAAGGVSISGGSQTEDPTGQNQANVSANGSINDSSSGVSIQGTASYYQPSNVNGKAVNAVQLATPMTFPKSSYFSSWQDSLLASSQEATQSYPSGNLNTGNLTFSSNGSISGPMYINGNLTVQAGSTLTVNADSLATQPIVVYVNGTVNCTGSILNKGVLIVSTGNQTYNGSANVYSVKNPNACGLISFSSDPNNAISVTAPNGQVDVGVAYAANGGVTFSGNSNFYGSITSAGASSTVSLANGAVLDYLGGNASWDPGGPWVPSALSAWIQVQ